MSYELGFLDDALTEWTRLDGSIKRLCIPQAGRFVWHKLYSSTQRRGFHAKAAKDRLQAMTVAALLTEQNGHLLVDALDALPESMRAAIVPLGQQLMQEGAAHPELGHPEHARLIVSIPVWFGE